MTAARPYLLDTNVFIQAHQKYYSLEICPGFWECLTHHCHQTVVKSIDRVRAEIKPGDALHEWANNAPPSMFASTADGKVAEVFAEMMSWVQNEDQFLPAARAEFAAAADGWLAAYASVNDCVVVTHEGFNAAKRNKVYLGNVCRRFGVDYVNTFDMLRTLKTQFLWHG